jgi:hypothetical protein
MRRLSWVRGTWRQMKCSVIYSAHPSLRPLWRFVDLGAPDVDWDTNRDEGGIPPASSILLPKGPASANQWTGKLLQFSDFTCVRESVRRLSDGCGVSSMDCGDTRPRVISTRAVHGRRPFSGVRPLSHILKWVHGDWVNHFLWSRRYHRISKERKLWCLQWWYSDDWTS